jgi:hypothetical protein
MSAAGGDRHELIRIFTEVGRALAHVDRRLPCLADATALGLDHGLVGVDGELVRVAHAHPGFLGGLEDRRYGEADDREQHGHPREAAERLAADDEHVATRHRLALVIAGGLGLLGGAVPGGGPLWDVGSVSQGQVRRTPRESIAGRLALL